MVQRVDEDPVEESSPYKDEQQEKDLTRRRFEPLEDQKEWLQVCSHCHLCSENLLRKCSCEPGVVAHAFNASIQQTEAGDLWVRGHPGLHSEFQDN